MNRRLFEVNWSLLDTYRGKIRQQLRSKLPADWQISDSEIDSEINMKFVYLIGRYEYLENGMSLESYCWKYAGKQALRSLYEEYNKLTKHVPIEETEDEDGNVRHEYGKAFLENSVDGYIAISKLTAKSDLQQLIDRHLKTLKPASRIAARVVLNLIASGQTERQAADLTGIPKTTVHRIVASFKDSLLLK